MIIEIIKNDLAYEFPSVFYSKVCRSLTFKIVSCNVYKIILFGVFTIFSVIISPILVALVVRAEFEIIFRFGIRKRSKRKPFGFKSRDLILRSELGLDVNIIFSLHKFRSVLSF